jgi:alkanesulfonate monooxygenase SsuD/methylene tetrahydromethanopterin reductase-like flavin-dependent oxidoreductase (luciferase family)
MKFGLHFQLPCSEDQDPARRYQETLEQAVLAEALGFESIWPVEQHFNAQVSLLSAPMMFLSAVAAKTSRIRLGTAITVLPLHQPVRVAEELATLDVLSQGRMEFGFGRGAMPSHFSGFGVALEESRERMFESLELIEKLLSEDNCTYAGKYYRVDGVSIAPKPIQNPLPRPRAAVNSMESFELMAKLGYPIFAASHINPFFMLKDFIGRYKQAFSEANHASGGCGDYRNDGSGDGHCASVDLLCPVFVDDDAASVRAKVQPSLDSFKAIFVDMVAPALTKHSISDLNERVAYLKDASFERYSGDSAIFGSPETVTKEIAALQSEFNIERLICWFNPGGLVTHEDVMAAMTLFSEQVMPHFVPQAKP